jgi:uncharacterized protein YndB with AHSA1/START domain
LTWVLGDAVVEIPDITAAATHASLRDELSQEQLVMTIPEADLGTVRTVDGAREGRLVRTVPHPPAAVWAMLTESERLPQWLAPGDIELRTGGHARLDFADSGTVVDSEVRAVTPSRLLEYSWSSGSEPYRPVRWELAPDSAGTQLTLTIRIPVDEDMARALAGWEAHLEMLLCALEGVPIKFPFERFKSMRERYRELLSRGC